MLLNQAPGTLSDGGTAQLPFGNTNDPSALTLFYPEGGRPGERFPLLTFGNGTSASPTFYEELIGFVVTYGFVVVAANSGKVGSGAEMLQALDWALAQDQQSGSPIQGRVERMQLGAFGHSQGGSGTVHVGADPRIRAIAPLSFAALLNDTGAATADVQCPAFYTLAQHGDFPVDDIRAAADATPAPTVWGVTNGGDHGEYADKADDPGVSGLTTNDALRTRAAIAAWFDWQLHGKEELRGLFVGPNCGFCRDSNWSLFESKGF